MFCSLSVTHIPWRVENAAVLVEPYELVGHSNGVQVTLPAVEEVRVWLQIFPSIEMLSERPVSHRERQSPVYPGLAEEAVHRVCLGRVIRLLESHLCLSSRCQVDLIVAEIRMLVPPYWPRIHEQKIGKFRSDKFDAHQILSVRNFRFFLVMYPGSWPLPLTQMVAPATLHISLPVYLIYLLWCCTYFLIQYTAGGNRTCTWWWWWNWLWWGGVDIRYTRCETRAGAKRPELVGCSAGVFSNAAQSTSLHARRRGVLNADVFTEPRILFANQSLLLCLSSLFWIHRTMW